MQGSEFSPQANSDRPVRFVLPPALLAQLRAYRDVQRERSGEPGQIEEEFDAFLLDPGMGPMVYLASDGRIVVDNRTWDSEDIVIETSIDDAISALVVGASKTGISDLLDLVPKLLDGTVCPLCNGTRWMKSVKVVCPACHGRGEVDDRLLSRARQEGLAGWIQYDQRVNKP